MADRLIYPQALAMTTCTHPDAPTNDWGRCLQCGQPQPLRVLPCIFCGVEGHHDDPCCDGCEHHGHLRPSCGNCDHWSDKTGNSGKCFVDHPQVFMTATEHTCDRWTVAVLDRS